MDFGVVYVNRYIGDTSMRTLHVIKEISLVAFDVANDVYRCQSRVNLLTSSTPCRGVSLQSVVCLFMLINYNLIFAKPSFVHTLRILNIIIKKYNNVRMYHKKKNINK